MSEKKTIRARLCVAVDARGQYTCAGWNGKDQESDIREQVLDHAFTSEFEEPLQVYWVTADLELPRRTEPEVQGAVEEDPCPET